MVINGCYNFPMKSEVSLFITTASGLLSLATGIYIFFKGRRQLVNILFFGMTFFLALWALGESMTLASASLDAKIFWTRFQGIGELPMVPTYLLLALYFPRTRKPMRDRSKAAALITGLYAPFLLGLVFLYTTRLIYTQYLPADNIHGLEVTRTPFFWFLTGLGLSLVLLGMVLNFSESQRSDSHHRRRGLLLLALAPLPMLAANLVQNFHWSGSVTTPQASLAFVGLLGYGIMRHGLFLDFRTAAKSAMAHAMAITVNLVICVLLQLVFRYGLGLGIRWMTFFLFSPAPSPWSSFIRRRSDWRKGSSPSVFTDRKPGRGGSWRS